MLPLLYKCVPPYSTTSGFKTSQMPGPEREKEDISIFLPNAITSFVSKSVEETDPTVIACKLWAGFDILHNSLSKYKGYGYPACQ